MYQKYYRRHMLKSALVIFFLLLLAILSTYHIYKKFSKQREKDYDSGEMEVIFHSKRGNEIAIKQYNPVTDAIGLTSPAYTFTVENNTTKDVKYKIIIKDDTARRITCGCYERQIPTELLKLSFRKDHQAPKALVLSEYPNGVLYTATLKPREKEDYSIRIWPMTSNFIVDRASHYHALIEVLEE